MHQREVFSFKKIERFPVAVFFKYFIFSINKIPLNLISSDFLASLNQTKKLVIIEDHVKRGGISEYIITRLSELNIKVDIKILCAKGYPNGIYGTQNFHHQISSMDIDSIKKLLIEWN